MPQAVFIGIGGIGSAVVTHIQRELKLRVASAGDNPAAKAQENNYQFLLVDTWEDENAQFFPPNQVFKIPQGMNRFDVHQRINAYWEADPFFKTWWPLGANGKALRVGDFHTGAGQIRTKGKLAYRISLDGGTAIVDGVNDAVNQIQNIVGVAGQLPIIPVYLVSSLGGGTGSGITLALAQHLRHTLPGNCEIIGVFPLASVTELGPPPALKNNIRANTDAALREIDYCQRAELEDLGLENYLAWGAAGRIPGDQAPFSYCYLFGRDNASDKNLESLDQYVRLIAESLTAESMSDLRTHGGLVGRVRSTHDNFIAHLDRFSEKRGRTQRYASAAVASLVYPFERIEQHLGRQFTIAVLDHMLDTPANRVSGLVDDFVTEERIAWQGNPSFSTRLLEPVELSGEVRNLGPFPRLQSAQDETFQDADRSRTLGYVEQVRTEFEGYIAERYRPHLAQRHPHVVAEFQAALRQYVEQTLIQSGPAGLAMAHAIVQELGKRLAAEERLVSTRIEGDKQAGEDGTLQRLTAIKEQWPAAVKRLGDGFGTLRERKGQKAKASFYRATWMKLRETVQEHEQLRAARTTYRQLESATREIESVLSSMVTSLRQRRDELARLTRVGLGQEGMSGVLDIAILDDPRLVSARFGELLADITTEGAGKCATYLTAHQLPGNEGAIEPGSPIHAGRVLEAFRERVEGRQLEGVLRDQIEHDSLAWGKNLIGTKVQNLTIWDALVAEYHARRQLDLPDQAVQAAVSLMDKDRHAAEQQGLHPPAAGWEAVATTYYIRQKLNQATNRARPFWKLDPVQIAAYGDDRYNFVVFATDETAYAQAISDPHLNLDGVLEDAAQALGDVGSTAWIPGKDRITIYTREGVAPLFYLAADELRHMRDATAANQGRNTYTDRRFEHLVDPTIAPPRPVHREPEPQRSVVHHDDQLEPALAAAPDNGHSSRNGSSVRRGSGYSSRFRQRVRTGRDA